MRVDITGSANIRPQENYVVAPLHEGFADVIALLQLPIRMRFVARGELLQWSVLGAALRSGKHIVVEPERSVAAYRELRRRAAVALQQESLVVFPQGTILGIESAFTGGAFHLARALERPLLPIVVTGSHRVWEHPYSPIVRFGQPVHIEVLPPVPPELAVATRRDIERTMKALALRATPPPRHFVPERDGWWDGYRYQIDPDFPELAARVADHRRRVADNSNEG
jgi:1-acyl-sn-glycerol-3-phosphate acyltransferase